MLRVFLLNYIFLVCFVIDACLVKFDFDCVFRAILTSQLIFDVDVSELINYTQPVYVWRDDPNSRQNTIKEIIERATSDDWPQVNYINK